MRHLQLTLQTPAENLALDEALLDAAEANELSAPVLRLWESPDYFVVLGRSSAPEVEVNMTACRNDHVPVLRRSSGGGTVLVGPGCLMYAVVLDFESHPEMQLISQAHQLILQKMAAAFTAEATEMKPLGTSDLAMRRSTQDDWKKISGNALRIKRRHLVYHGTLLYAFDLDRIGRWLATPTRSPEYRDSRNHTEFVTNLPWEREQIVERLFQCWQVEQPLSEWPETRTRALASSRYSSDPQWVLFPTT